MSRLDNVSSYDESDLIPDPELQNFTIGHINEYVKDFIRRKGFIVNTSAGKIGKYNILRITVETGNIQISTGIDISRIMTSTEFIAELTKVSARAVLLLPTSSSVNRDNKN